MTWQKNGAADEKETTKGGKHWLAGLLILVITFIAYHPAWHAGFIWDDDAYVTANPLLSAPDGLRRIWFSLDSPSQYFPLTYTTFYMERALWGLNPAGYHLVNILLHAINACLVWRVLGLLQVRGAWLAAALFALHPVQVESVAWITERKNVLMGFFYLLTVLAWLRFTDGQTRRPRTFYALALICFALALCAKTTACTLPIVLLLILWLKKIPIRWRRVGEVAPFVAMGIGMGLLTMWWERHHQGTHGGNFAIGPMERVLIASRALWFYAGKLIWPANLTFSYPRWTIVASDPRAYAWLAATAVLGVVIWRFRFWAGRGVVVAAAFFAVTLGPVLGFIMLYTFEYSFVADHYQYLACIGPLALAAAGLTVTSARFIPGKWLPQAALAAVLIGTLTLLTWRQCGMYANIETLWQATIRRNPDSWMARSNLASSLSAQGRTDEAITQFQKALEIKPDNAEARRNLGLALFRTSRLDEAAGQFQKALEIEPDNAETHVDLGNCLSRMGQPDEAVAQYQRALEIQPDNAEAHNDLGNSFLRMGRLDEAIEQFQKAVEIRPDMAEAQNDLGACYYHQGRLDEAIAHYQTAVEIKPQYEEARMNLGNILLNVGRPAEAIAQFQEAAKIAPADPRALVNLAWPLATCAEASLRDGKQAVELARRATHLDGGQNPNFLHTLAAALAEVGQFPEAIQTAQQALTTAQDQANPRLAAQLQFEMSLYQAGKAFHVPAHPH